MTRFCGLKLLVLAVPLVLTGCAATQIQIWANSDSDDPKIYTQRTPQYVHVGEPVQFRVLIQPPDAASYMLAEAGGQLAVMARVNPGEYGLVREFDAGWRDRSCPVVVQAYRQNGRPDYLIQADGTVRKQADSNDPPDIVVATATMRVECYQSKVVFEVRLTGDAEPDWSRTRLQLYGPNDRVTTLRRAGDGVRGFTPVGRDAGGRYTVFYEPIFDQIHRTGKTRAVLIVPDPAGKGERSFEAWISTP